MARSGPTNRVLALLLVVGGVGALGAAYYGSGQRVPEPVALAVPGAAVGGDAAVAVVAPVAPRFDIVRVSPQGDAVIAGRAEPGAEVVVRDGAQVVARALADRSGAFVALSPAALPPGGSALTLSSRVDGRGDVAGDGAVVVIVPAAGPGAGGAVAVLAPVVGPSRVLQGGPGYEGAAALSLDVVDYDEAGAIRFMGRAVAGAGARLYVDDGFVGEGRADSEGRWSLTLEGAVGTGLHRLRVDGIDEAGRVTGRIALPFERASLAVGDGVSRVVVQPGQSLWRLAQAAYGRGTRYSVIYLANRERIRDPNLIYPGQAFAVPVR